MLERPLSTLQCSDLRSVGSLVHVVLPDTPCTTGLRAGIRARGRVRVERIVLARTFVRVCPECGHQWRGPESRGQQGPNALEMFGRKTMATGSSATLFSRTRTSSQLRLMRAEQKQRDAAASVRCPVCVETTTCSRDRRDRVSRRPWSSVSVRRSPVCPNSPTSHHSSRQSGARFAPKRSFSRRGSAGIAARCSPTSRTPRPPPLRPRGSTPGRRHLLRTNRYREWER